MVIEHGIEIEPYPPPQTVEYRAYTKDETKDKECQGCGRELGIETIEMRR
jgi:hypothetical protein